MDIRRLVREMVDDGDERSFSHRMRSRRFGTFERATGSLDGTLSILDIGGTAEFWENRGWADRPGVEITLVNLFQAAQRFENIVPTVGDATSLDLPDDAFDVAFSNSVIEHLRTGENQRRMAAEVERVARAYWIQTPNYWFPIEPHYLTPGWQWLPVRVRVEILRRRPVGQMGRCPDRAFAEHTVREVQLLSRRGLTRLFPEATLIPERFGGLVKSWTAVHGLPA
jgi:Methyltransferase domain